MYVFLTDLELWPDCELPESHFHLRLPDDPNVQSGGSKSGTFSVQCGLWVSQCLKVK